MSGERGHGDRGINGTLVIVVAILAVAAVLVTALIVHGGKGNVASSQQSRAAATSSTIVPLPTTIATTTTAPTLSPAEALAQRSQAWIARYANPLIVALNKTHSAAVKAAGISSPTEAVFQNCNAGLENAQAGLGAPNPPNPGLQNAWIQLWTAARNYFEQCTKTAEVQGTYGLLPQLNALVADDALLAGAENAYNDATGNG